MYGHFYDNCIGNMDVHSLCPYIIFHKVRDNPQFVHGDKDAFKAFVKNEPKDVQTLAQLYLQHFRYIRYDPMSGNVLQNGDDFFEHVMHVAEAPNVSTLIFDWDRTLQQFECMSTHSFAAWCAELNATTPEDIYKVSKSMAILHSGGTERFIKLRRMFKHIQRHRKSIYIITANPAIMTNGHSLYIEILNRWGVKSFKIMYSTDKYRTMAHDNGLRIYCGPKLEF